MYEGLEGEGRKARKVPCAASEHKAATDGEHVNAVFTSENFILFKQAVVRKGQYLSNSWSVCNCNSH